MNKLKNVLAIFLLLGSTYVSKAQDCNFDKDEKDKFTGEITRMADQRMGNITTHWNLILEQKGTKYYLGLRLLRSTAITNPVLKGEKFYLKLEDGKVLAIAADKDYAPTFYSANGGVQTTINTRGEVDLETLKSLSASPVTDIKITVGGNDMTQSSIPSKQTKKVMEYAACLAASK